LVLLVTFFLLFIFYWLNNIYILYSEINILKCIIKYFIKYLNGMKKENCY